MPVTIGVRKEFRRGGLLRRGTASRERRIHKGLPVKLGQTTGEAKGRRAGDRGAIKIGGENWTARKGLTTIVESYHR